MDSSPVNYNALQSHFIVISQDPGPLLRILPGPRLRLNDWLDKSLLVTFFPTFIPHSIHHFLSPVDFLHRHVFSPSEHLYSRVSFPETASVLSIGKCPPGDMDLKHFLVVQKSKVLHSFKKRDVAGNGGLCRFKAPWKIYDKTEYSVHGRRSVSRRTDMISIMLNMPWDRLLSLFRQYTAEFKTKWDACFKIWNMVIYATTFGIRCISCLGSPIWL
jgi:hypothetical protein